MRVPTTSTSSCTHESLRTALVEAREEPHVSVIEEVGAEQLDPLTTHAAPVQCLHVHDNYYLFSTANGINSVYLKRAQSNTSGTQDLVALPDMSVTTTK